MPCCRTCSLNAQEMKESGAKIKSAGINQGQDSGRDAEGDGGGGTAGWSCCFLRYWPETRETVPSSFLLAVIKAALEDRKVDSH